MKVLTNSFLYIILVLSSSFHLYGREIPKSDFYKRMDELHSYYSTHLGDKDKYPKSCLVADAIFYYANCESLFDLPDPRVNRCKTDAEAQYKNFVSSAYALCQTEEELKKQGQLKEDKAWTLVSENEMQSLANTLLPLHQENKLTTTFGKHCGDFFILSTMKDSKDWLPQIMSPYMSYEEPLKVKDARFKQFKQLTYALCKVTMALKETTSPDLERQREKETPQIILERKVKNLVSQGKLSFEPSFQDLAVLAKFIKELEKEGFDLSSTKFTKKDKEEL